MSLRVKNFERVAKLVRYLQVQPMHLPDGNPSPERAMMILREVGGHGTTWPEVFAAMYVHAQALRELLHLAERERPKGVPRPDPLPTEAFRRRRSLN